MIILKGMIKDSASNVIDLLMYMETHNGTTRLGHAVTLRYSRCMSFILLRYMPTFIHL